MSRPSPHHQQPPLQPPQTPSTRLNLEITIISGKHLKNVNWKNGDLKPYAIFWIDPNHKLTTKSDDSGNTKPVWNQRFLLPINSPLSDAFLSLEIFHSKTSETPKPFVGSLQLRLSSLPEPDNPNIIRTLDLLRPSGRAHGKIRLKLVIKEQPLPQQPPPPPQPQPQPQHQPQPQPSHLDYDYQTAPHPGYYYSSAPPYPYTSSRSVSPALPPIPSPPHPAYPYSMGYYSGYYPSSGARSYGAPSAPVDYSQFDQRSRTGGGYGVGTGLAVGAVAGALGGVALDEGLKYEEGKIAERVDDNYLGTARDDFSDYRGDF
ncbi:BON1-associated protein 2 [Bienertia sinuspersici]